MTRPHVPQSVLDAAHARSAARAAHDWDEADRLRAEIEAAGWTIVDRGTDFALSAALPSDVVEGERVRFGASAGVPSRWDDPPVGLATVVLAARDDPARFEVVLAAILATAPAGTSIIVVADAPSVAQEASLDAAPPPADRVEVVWTRDRLGDAADRDVGHRRALGPIVILLGSDAEPSGDLVTPLAAALDDPTVAVAGGWGTTSTDLRRFTPAPAGEVDAIDGTCLAFRRADAAARGPLDERFQDPATLATWWSLVLRDAGEDATPRRAVAVVDLPILRHGLVGTDGDTEPPRDRSSRRDRYRIIDRFGWRRDLLIGG